MDVNKNNMKKLSIIIPHYNSPDLLKKLLDSVPVNYDIEVIVVDDRSDKDIEKYQLISTDLRYEHIAFLKNTYEKKGAGTCRNIGLEKAKGEWVLFADADDYFVDGWYEKVLPYFKTDNDVVFFMPTSRYIDRDEETDRHLNFKEKLDDYIAEKSIKNQIKLRYEIPSPVSKMIRRSFINNNNILFDEVLASNDVMFSTKVGYFMKKFEVSREIIYCMTRSEGSLTMQISEKIYNNRLCVYINHCNFLKNNLKKDELKYLNLTGQTMISMGMRYNYSIKKIFSIIITLKKNKIKLFQYKLFNPIYFIKKVIKNIKIYKNEKKYLRK